MMHTGVADRVYCMISKSIKKGWEIMCVISVTFPPSKNLETYLTNFVEQNTNHSESDIQIMSRHVLRTLKRICARGARGKVLTAAEIERAKVSWYEFIVISE